MARILEMILIANGLAGIGSYFGWKIHRVRKATRAGINKAAGSVGFEVKHEDELSPEEEKWEQHAARPPEKPKRSRLARFGATIGGEK